MLANVVRKPMQQIFSEFAGTKPGEGNEYFGTGDVKYHLGTSYDRPTITGKHVHLSLLANPSHLEVRHSCGVSTALRARTSPVGRQLCKGRAAGCHSA